MATLDWCCKKTNGIGMIKQNENLSEGYIKMAEAAIGTMNREKNFNMQFAISACYYSMYYSLYAILMKVGIKCEIHICTLEFMKVFLSNFYSKEDFEIIKKAFDARNTSQYYVDKIVAKEDIDFIMNNAPYFFDKSKDVLSKINEKNIKDIRDEINRIV